jgi:hypothetical protein
MTEPLSRPRAGIEESEPTRASTYESAPNLLSQAVTTVGAAQDRVGRAGVGLAMAATIGSAMRLPGIAERDRASIRFYAEAGRGGDPSVLFQAPEVKPLVSVGPGQRHVLNKVAAEVEDLRYPSTYIPANPLVRETFADHDKNRYAWAQLWRHGDRPRPTIVAGHGFTLSSWAINSTFLAMQSFYRRGCDVALITSPFHGRRRGRGEPFNGSGMFQYGAAHSFEAILQGVHDLRALVTHLFGTGTPQVGVTGLSLGGLLSGLLAATDDRVSFVVPNAPPTDLAELIQLWGPLGPVVNRSLRIAGVDPDEFAVATTAVSPVAYPSLLPRERLMIIAGRGDRFVMPRHVSALWEHWDRPKIHWYPGNHVIHVGRRHYLKRMHEFVESTGFYEGS